MEQIYDNWHEHDLDIAMQKHDFQEGYEPKRYAADAHKALTDYIEAHYLHESIMSAKDFSILNAALHVLKEKSQ